MLELSTLTFTTLLLFLQLASCCYDYSDPDCFEKRMKELQDRLDE